MIVYPTPTLTPTVPNSPAPAYSQQAPIHPDALPPHPAPPRTQRQPHVQYPRLTGDPAKSGSWPPNWQKFLNLARAFALNDILFVHGFPKAFSLRSQAGEALTHAWQAHSVWHPNEPLSKAGCKSVVFYSGLTLIDSTVDDYRDYLRKIVSARVLPFTDANIWP